VDSVQYIDMGQIKRASTKQHNKKTNNALRVAGRELSYGFRSRKEFHAFAGKFLVSKKNGDDKLEFSGLTPEGRQSKDPKMEKVRETLATSGFAGTLEERMVGAFRIADLLLYGREQTYPAKGAKSKFFNRSI